MRIIIADDQDFISSGLRARFPEEKGIEICAEAVDGRDALAKLLEFRPKSNVPPLKWWCAATHIRPIRLRLVKEPFDHHDYIFELKHDGFRAVTYIQNANARFCPAICGS
jgi:hypothetical protein